MLLKKIIIPFIASLVISSLYAQNDKQKLSGTSLLDTSVTVKADTVIAPKNTALMTDSMLKKKHDPSKATRHSAIIPGWGQVYNGQAWKLPLVYGALAVPAVAFIYNDKWYKRTKYAYVIVVNNDTANFKTIDPKLIYKTTGYPLAATDLQYYRNSFRKDRDYSVLFFLLAWGVNVVDATVFGHLKEFDVSDDLSMHIKPTYDFSLKTTGMSVAFNFKTASRKALPSF
ncbi:hypothetical protein BH11BAC6_BH11BAC6_15640 [soil metagenome]